MAFQVPPWCCRGTWDTSKNLASNTNASLWEHSSGAQMWQRAALQHQQVSEPCGQNCRHDSWGKMTDACFKHNALKQPPYETTPTLAALVFPSKDCDGFNNGVHDYMTGSKRAVWTRLRTYCLHGYFRHGPPGFTEKRGAVLSGTPFMAIRCGVCPEWPEYSSHTIPDTTWQH